jgi:hypothetical protein
MTGLEYVLAATFVAVGATPLLMALRWSRRLKRAARRHALASAQAGGPASSRVVADTSVTAP